VTLISFTVGVLHWHRKTRVIQSAMVIYRRYWLLWISAVCFYVITILCIMSYDVTSPKADYILDADVTVTRQPVADVAATTVTTTENSVASINCSQKHDLPLPDHITAGCPNSSSWTCAQINCDRLLSKPPLLDNTTINYMAWRTAAAVTDSDVIKLTGDCAKFRLSRDFVRSTSPNNVDDDDDDFPLAFNILAHRDADQVIVVYSHYERVTDRRTDRQTDRQISMSVERCVVCMQRFI